MSATSLSGGPGQSMLIYSEVVSQLDFSIVESSVPFRACREGYARLLAVQSLYTKIILFIEQSKDF